MRSGPTPVAFQASFLGCRVEEGQGDRRRFPSPDPGVTCLKEADSSRGAEGDNTG